ncbi:MAG: zinc-ribbon domain-containing protein [Candidatus Micrarchaeales archaeon]|nr:zinc-ribbon domain-containing protein [Candidatus Micrarchaeales archaeon]
MTVYPEDVNAAKKYLWPEEKVYVTAMQRKIGPGGALINQTSVIATDKRLMIINRETLGVRKDVETIPYNSIASVRLENGLISSSVFIVVAGYVSPKGEQGFLKPGESEGEIGGLHKPDAKALADFVQKMIVGISPSETAGEGAGSQARGGQQATAGAYVYCSKCGTRNDASAKFCTNCGAELSK